jgi:hypothetical protein
MPFSFLGKVQNILLYVILPLDHDDNDITLWFYDSYNNCTLLLILQTKFNFYLIIIILSLLYKYFT